MPPSNRASWLMAKHSPVNVVDSAPYTSPLDNELVIRTKAIALNPTDVAAQKLGILLKDFPAILGCDVAGEVVEVHFSLADVSTSTDIISSTIYHRIFYIVRKLLYLLSGSVVAWQILL